MISLQQIKVLEEKVSKAVDLINLLRKENKALNDTLGSSQKKIQDLEKLVKTFKDDQDEIEHTIVDAIKTIENAVTLLFRYTWPLVLDHHCYIILIISGANING